ncbi:MAG: recombinase family protein [Candidatus Marinimicrobia bacterium]|nr:recombinase family protein [Bacteroidales bacterium]MCK5331801.1 recombinase family protein [Candidatus Neomarinimicrobiota bacterium]
MLVGYARVSTVEQNVDLQMDTLEKAGRDKFMRIIQVGSRLIVLVLTK